MTYQIYLFRKKYPRYMYMLFASVLLKYYFFVKLANSNEEDFKMLLDSEEYEFRFDCGICKPSSLIPFVQKAKVVTKMCLHYTI